MAPGNTPLLLSFSEGTVAETREISENLYVDFDSHGNLVCMTIEQAKARANISEVSFLQMTSET